MFCPNCGRELAPGENVCRACSAVYASPYSRDTVMFLCVIGFLGLSGLHRFYVGRWKGGVLFLLTGGLSVSARLLIWSRFAREPSRMITGCPCARNGSERRDWYEYGDNAGRGKEAAA